MCLRRSLPHWPLRFGRMITPCVYWVVSVAPAATVPSSKLTSSPVVQLTQFADADADAANATSTTSTSDAAAMTPVHLAEPQRPVTYTSPLALTSSGGAGQAPLYPPAQGWSAPGFEDSAHVSSTEQTCELDES